MTIRAVNEQTLPTWTLFASQVWQTSEQVLIEKFSNNEFPFEFLYYSQSEEPIAWISLSLRHDYVEGCQTSPVAYLEGIFISPNYRSQGIAEELLHFAEGWAKSRGIGQLGSDAELDNLLSQKFHIKHGFREVSRTVHYVRNLNSE
ncbi:TPA: GNAT family N-acetyltransferase [Streptococcus suis]|uniref:GNAT family N-acetyltransferase n=1 Tax=Streptococcus suis TaxID=1307 RepID=UPI000413BC4B|nr:GNAT family N-acetyltransferase [Streptococcus suis]MDW8732078.1 GNAT family N-acetyltransferase [Streptococcus suis]QZT29963.1 GNAT family N-acetyltransferase [Streptococcus suis]HEM3164011.1 GNAT family N-acetyltransferase [Streptococcus suis 92-1191]HEM4415068.1 GNAT family N-acetyltransferase [Streptococcus suis]HEM4557295.1 GNAT family N-acetyltransferase [Streptococcus suis]